MGTRERDTPGEDVSALAAAALEVERYGYASVAELGSDGARPTLMVSPQPRRHLPRRARLRMRLHARERASRQFGSEQGPLYGACCTVRVVR